MFRLKEGVRPEDLGFRRKDVDYVITGDIDGAIKILFKIYRGSGYIRSSRTSYVSDDQLRLIHEWTKQDYIEWE